MRKNRFQPYLALCVSFVWLFMSNSSFAQQLNVRDFVLFGGGLTCPGPNQSTPLAPGCGVQIGSSGTVSNGKIGSYHLVKTTGNAVLTSDIHSGGRIELSNSNTVNGNITAGATTTTQNLLLQAGSNLFVSGDVMVNGSATISGGTLNGFLMHPSETSYSGPVPKNKEVLQKPNLPVLPNLPPVSQFPAAGVEKVITTAKLKPYEDQKQVYGEMALNGSKTVTFIKPGIYVFKNIKNTGNANKFVFDFKLNPTGIFKIYVHDDVDLAKLNVELINGGSASQVFMEVHGNGSTSPNGTYAWMITNGASGNNQSVWNGTVWAPFGGINVGSGSSPSKVIGSLWSGTQVILDNGVSVTYAMYAGCDLPNVSAGTDKGIDCDHPQTQLNGSSTTVGVQFKWSVVGGSFVSAVPNPVVSAGGIYILTVTEPNCGMAATDTVIVTNTPCILPYYPPSVKGKVETKIGSELTSLNANFGKVSDSAKAIFFLSADDVLIDVIVNQGNYTAISKLLIDNYGLRDTISNGPNSLTLTGWFPIVNLPVLNTLAGVNHCRPAFPAINSAGITNTLGDSAMRTNFVRNGYGLTGSGVKVGVLSDSYNTLPGDPAAIDVQNGDLPGGAGSINENPVEIVKEYPFGQRSDEGRAMLQIIHDVAPKAKLAFRTGFLTAGDLAQGIRELAAKDCKVIVDDITFITEPFFKKGVVENSISDVTASGVNYVTAAGNFGVKSYESIFQPEAGNPPGGLTGKAHNFGNGDIFQNDSLKGSVLQPGIYTIVLQWQDDIYSLGNNSGTVNDLDIYLTDDNGVTLFGFNRNNVGGDPIEVLPFTVTANTATNILIVNASASSTATTSHLRFKYVVFRGDIKINEYNQGNSTIVGHSNAADAITVGAALYTNTPAFGVQLPTIASFSSRGGTPVNNTAPAKPDLVAPNGVNTTVNFGSVDLESDNLPNFFGTSAAAPHVAGAVALMSEAKTKYYGQALSPADARSLLKSGAIDMDAQGFDYNTGNGFVNVDSSMRALANPTPQVTKLALADSSLTAGAVPVNLIIQGNYFTANSKVLFGTDTLNATIQNSTTALASLPVFTDEKLISIYTPPKSLVGNDGGLSNGISITGVPKKVVTVIANNKTKKYGEVMPSYTATVLIDNDSLSHTSISLADLGLTTITFTTPATPLSNVGSYFIRPSRVFVAGNAGDSILLSKYNYVFTDGILSVEKLPVTVTPRDTTLVYGQKVGDIHFTYRTDPSVLIDQPAILNHIISTAHQSQLANDVIGLVNSQAVTIVNNQAIPIVNGQAVTIVNGQAVTIVNGQAVPIVNSQAIAIVNNQAVPIVNTLTDQQVDSMSFMVSSATVQNARQVINKVLVNGNLVTQTTNVIDITQESILDFGVNPVQTELLTSVSNTTAKGIVSVSALINGQAVTIVNNQAIPIVNGQAVTIVNGQAVTIVNGQAVAIVNNESSTFDKTAVIIDEGDLTESGVNHLKSINIVTGLTSGIQTIIPGTLLDNNLRITYDPGRLTILPAPITLKAKDTAKLYGESLQLDQTRFTITSGTLQFEDSITSVTLQSAGAAPVANAGSYAIIPSAAVGYLQTNVANYAITYANGQLTVGKVPVLVKADNASRIYGTANPTFAATYSGFVNGQTFASSGIAGAPSLTTTATISSVQGEYPIAAALGTLSSTSYSFRFTNGILTVTPAPLTVKADDQVIFQGDPLPASFTGTITGLKNGDVANYSYAVSGYTGAAGVYPIVPTLVSFTKANNYTITVLNGNLYVNPKGANAKKLRPYLDCVEEVPGAPANRRYIAHFFCENTNATPVYVPIGIDNKITSRGSFDASGQPVLFMPGTSRFDIPFDGAQLSWELRTYETNKKTSIAGVASSSSNKCNFNYTTSTRQGGVSINTEPLIEMNERVELYPNPVKNRVLVKSPYSSINDKSLMLFDAAGRNYPVKVSKRVSEKQVELDLSSLVSGIYFLKMTVPDGYKTLRIIKN